MTYTIRLGISFDYDVNAKTQEEAIEKAKDKFTKELISQGYDFNTMCEGIEDGNDLDFIPKVIA